MMVILFLACVNLAITLFILVQNSNTINALEILLERSHIEDMQQGIAEEDDLSVRLREFQKMKFSKISSGDKK